MLTTPDGLKNADAAQTLLRTGQVTTPFLMMDRSHIADNVARWLRLLPDVALHYAVKCNNDPLVLDLLNRLGVHFDAASRDEMEQLTRIGVDGSRIILSHPAKPPDTIEAMKTVRPWAFVVDEEAELARVNRAGVPFPGYDPVLLVRLRVQARNVQQDLSSKFGCRTVSKQTGAVDPRRALAILTEARQRGFQTFGLSFHVGTQCYDPANYGRALAICEDIAAATRQHGFPIKWIDIGGGFCDSRIAAAHGTSHDELLANVGALAAAVTGRGFRLLGEPGRYIVADAGTVVMGIVSTYASAESSCRIRVDEGIYGALCGQWHDAREWELQPVRIDPAKPPFSKQMVQVEIWGPTCDSFDKLSGQAPFLLPADIGPGDYLLAPCAGAYSSSAGTNFNGLAPARVVMI